jgi:hypothetical protein
MVTFMRTSNSTYGIAQSVYGLGYCLESQGIGIRFPAEATDFSLPHRYQTGSGAHPASFAMSTGSFYREGKVAGAVHHSSQSSAENKNVRNYTSAP